MLFGDPVNTSVLPANPAACTAFPAEGSAFAHVGMASLGLQAFRPFAEELSCASLSHDGNIRPGPKVFFPVAHTCLKTGRDNPEMRSALHYRGLAHASARSFRVASDALRMPDGRYTLALAPNPRGLGAMTVNPVGPDRARLWEERGRSRTSSPCAEP